MFKAGEGAGKSGSFFFHSFDKKFLIKTMTRNEHKKFQKIADGYIEHFRNHPNSLLSKILGVFKVKISTAGHVYLMLMENTLQFRNEDNIDFIFDLKGSTYKRKFKGQVKKTSTFKDMNLLIATKANPQLITLGKRTRDKVVDVIRADMSFLRKHNIIDYSLLLGIET